MSITPIIWDFGNYPIVNIDFNKVIFDAGGGTGRWICDLGKIYKNKFILYDLSEDMLKVAEQNIKKAKIEKRTEVIQGNLENIDKIADESVDYIISIYSPISFVAKKEQAIKELRRILKKRGKILIMGHGFCNALASKINNYRVASSELETLDLGQMVKWGNFVPKLNLFSMETMGALLSGAGFSLVQTYGVPVFVQPQQEDFDPKNFKKSRISNALENSAFFEQVFKLEMKYNSQKDIANRGMNIFAVAKK
jgi:ubiquinone/menaquinone biosynthesis C-methylase UbiE